MGWIRSRVALGVVVLACLGAAGGGGIPSPEFRSTGDLQDGPRGHQKVVRLKDGRVFIVGGAGLADGSSKTTAEVYDPATGTWSLAGTMSVGRHLCSVNLLADGRVLVAGGENLATVHASCEIWDPATGQFTDAGPMGAPRAAHASVTLDDGRVMVTGGVATTSGPVALFSSEIYDPATDAWSPAGSMHYRHQAHPAVLLADGRVMVAGGDAGSANAYKGTVFCEIYDPSTDLFVIVAPMSNPRTSHAMARLADGRVLVVGGDAAATGSPQYAMEIYDPATNVWIPWGGSTSGGSFPTLTALPDGRALATGGGPTGTGATAAADLIDTKTGAPAIVGRMLLARRNHSATLLEDGNVLIAGGYTGATAFPYWTSTCERLDLTPWSTTEGLRLIRGKVHRRSHGRGVASIQAVLEVGDRVPDGILDASGGILLDLDVGDSFTVQGAVEGADVAVSARGRIVGRSADGSVRITCTPSGRYRGRYVLHATILLPSLEGVPAGTPTLRFRAGTLDLTGTLDAEAP